MEVESIKYNRATNQLEVNIRNTEEQAVYFKGTYSLKAAGLEQTVGDIDPIFLDGNELKTVVYDVEPIPEGKITADVYIIYGESKGSMEKVIDTTMDIEVVEILDKCEISLNNLVYNKRKGIFYIEVENIAEVDCYIDVELVDLLIDGVRQSFSAEEILHLEANQKKKQKVNLKLEEEDIENNNAIKVKAYYGERKDSLVKILESEFELVFTGIDYLFYSLLLVILILIFLVIWKRRKAKKKEKGF